METAQAIARVRAGDTDAYRHIITRYQREVWRVVAWGLHDASATEDLTQQAFINAYLNLDRYRDGEDFGAWLRTIARNLVRNELRRRAREDQRMRHYDVWLRQQLRDPIQAERDAQAMDEALRACRQQLAPTAARAVELRYDQGRTFADIARELDRTIAAARQMLQRVRAALRRCVTRYNEPT